MSAMYTPKNRFHGLVIVLILNLYAVSGKSINLKRGASSYGHSIHIPITELHEIVGILLFYWILKAGLLPSEKCSCAAIRISSTGPANQLQPVAMGLYKVVKTKIKQFETKKKFKHIVHLLIKKSKTIYKNNNNLFLTGGKLSSWKVLKRYYDNDKVKYQSYLFRLQILKFKFNAL